MKKTSLSSTVFMWLSFAFGIIAMLMMFVPCLLVDEKPINASSIFFTIGDKPGVWPAFIGYMCIIAASIVVAILGLPVFQPSRKKEMRMLISSNILLVIGIVLVMLMKVEYCGSTDRLATMFTVHLHAGPYITMGFGIFALACNTYAMKLDW